MSEQSLDIRPWSATKSDQAGARLASAAHVSSDNNVATEADSEVAAHDRVKTVAIGTICALVAQEEYRAKACEMFWGRCGDAYAGVRTAHRVSDAVYGIHT